MENENEIENPYGDVTNDYGTDSFNTDFDFGGMNFRDEINTEPIYPLFAEFEIEKNLREELNDFVRRDFQQRKLIAKQTDISYYFVMTFQSQTQRDRFLKELKLMHLLRDDYFINGLEASEHLGIEQERIELSKARFRKNFTNDYI